MSTFTVVMVAPTNFGGTVSGTPSGTVYAPNASGQVTVNSQDIITLQKLGFNILDFQGGNPSGMMGILLGANFNVTTDQKIPLFVSPLSPFRVSKISVTNASVSLTTAAGGVYDAASKGGNALVASSQAYTALSAATKMLDLTLALDLREPAGTSLYLSLTTAQGAAATADVYVFGDVLSQ